MRRLTSALAAERTHTFEDNGLRLLHRKHIASHGCHHRLIGNQMVRTLGGCKRPFGVPFFPNLLVQWHPCVTPRLWLSTPAIRGLSFHRELTRFCEHHRQTSPDNWVVVSVNDSNQPLHYHRDGLYRL